MNFMKKFLKVGICFLLICSFLNINMYTASAASVTYSKASDIAAVCFNGYNGGSKGPIMLLKASYYMGSSTVTVYLVCLSGTEMVTGQSTGAWTDLQSGFEANSDYLTAAINAIRSNVPTNSNLILAGHSLGGMIAQQLAGNNNIKNYYNVMNVVTFGSPLVNASNREGTLKRLGDTSDLVPYLSATAVIQYGLNNSTLQREDGGYGGYTNFVTAHNNSYQRSALWGGYDVVGTKGGKAKLTFDISTMKYFKAPDL